MRDLERRIARIEQHLRVRPPAHDELDRLARWMSFEEICALQQIAEAAGLNRPPTDDPLVLAVAQAACCREAGRQVAALF